MNLSLFPAPPTAQSITPLPEKNVSCRHLFSVFQESRLQSKCSVRISRLPQPSYMSSLTYPNDNMLFPWTTKFLMIFEVQSSSAFGPQTHRKQLSKLLFCTHFCKSHHWPHFHLIQLFSRLRRSGQPIQQKNGSDRNMNTLLLLMMTAFVCRYLNRIHCAREYSMYGRWSILGMEPFRGSG
jgi:hypothetical protein